MGLHELPRQLVDRARRFPPSSRAGDPSIHPSPGDVLYVHVPLPARARFLVRPGPQCGSRSDPWLTSRVLSYRPFAATSRSSGRWKPRSIGDRCWHPRESISRAGSSTYNSPISPPPLARRPSSPTLTATQNQISEGAGPTAVPTTARSPHVVRPEDPSEGRIGEGHAFLGPGPLGTRKARRPAIATIAGGCQCSHRQTVIRASTGMVAHLF